MYLCNIIKPNGNILDIAVLSDNSDEIVLMVSNFLNLDPDEYTMEYISTEIVELPFKKIKTILCKFDYSIESLKTSKILTNLIKIYNYYYLGNLPESELYFDYQSIVKDQITEEFIEYLISKLFKYPVMYGNIGMSSYNPDSILLKETKLDNISVWEYEVSFDINLPNNGDHVLYSNPLKGTIQKNTVSQNKIKIEIENEIKLLLQAQDIRNLKFLKLERIDYIPPEEVMVEEVLPDNEIIPDIII